MIVKTVRIIRASGPDRDQLLDSRIKEIESSGIKVLYTDVRPDPNWPYCSSSIPDRSRSLNEALIEEGSDAVWWARGGYGASELLEHIPWKKVLKAKSKPIIGCSDACAAQSALYATTGRPSIHAPMPANSLWNQQSEEDTKALLAMLKTGTWAGGFTITGPDKMFEGAIFGGNLAVLTSLIGTPYLPKTLNGFILLFEDIAENPGRVMRMLNQWKQSGLLNGVRAVILGSFKDLGGGLPDSSPVLFDEIKRRFALPFYVTTSFGHVSPNYSFVIGAKGKIDGNQFSWSYAPPEDTKPIS